VVDSKRIEEITNVATMFPISHEIWQSNKAFANFNVENGIMYYEITQRNVSLQAQRIRQKFCLDGDRPN